MYDEVRVSEALLYACMKGNLETARWLHETFNLTPSAGVALILACRFGHLDAAKWLKETFDLTMLTV
jgi:hypothetical protein